MTRRPARPPSAELAGRDGLHELYVGEWLEAMTSGPAGHTRRGSAWSGAAT
jgi:hypothetical protein